MGHFGFYFQSPFERQYRTQNSLRASTLIFECRFHGTQIDLRPVLRLLKINDYVGTIGARNEWNICCSWLLTQANQ